MVEREAARVVGRTAVLPERAARRGDLVHVPGAAGPARVVVAVVGHGGEAREQDHRVPGARLGSHVVHPGRLRAVEDEVPGLGSDRRTVEAADLLSVRPLDPARPDARVVDVHARVLVRVGVRVRHVDGVAAALRELRVRALARHQDQVARRRPRPGAVGLDGEGRVVVAAPPEQIGAALAREPDRVRIGVAAYARDVHGKRLRRLPRADVPGLRRDPVVHRRPDVAGVEDDEAPVRAHVDGGIRVVVAVQPRGEHRGHTLAAARGRTS